MSSWTISRRVAAGFIVVVCLAIAIGAASLWRMLGINGHVVAISTNVVPSFPILGGIIQADLAVLRAVSDAALRSGEPARVAAAERRFATAVATGSTLCGNYKKIFSDDKDRELFMAAVTARDRFLAAARQALTFVADGRGRDARDLLESQVEP
ncbi:MAG: MCP four helix bundle domain-containing protein, partial [Planctomycetia bacterium]